MKNTTKLEKVKKFLDENGIKWHEPKKKGKRGHSDLVLPDFRIYIKVSGDEDQVFFEKHKDRNRYPVFIRDGETPKFVLEKVQNTIVKSMKRKQGILLARMKRKAEKDSKH